MPVNIHEWRSPRKNTSAFIFTRKHAVFLETDEHLQSANQHVKSAFKRKAAQGVHTPVLPMKKKNTMNHSCKTQQNTFYKQMMEELSILLDN